MSTRNKPLSLSLNIQIRTMAATGWVVMLVALLSPAFAVAHSHSGETETNHVSVGHLFILKCPFAQANVTWSRLGWHNLSLPTGVDVKDGVLRFLPVQMAHNGSYTCETRGKTGLTKIHFGVLVSSGQCPDPLETKSVGSEVSIGLPCKQSEVFSLNGTRTIRWMKDCNPVEQQGGHISVNDKGYMRLHRALESDAGIYTCLVDINLNGRKYTAARSTRLTVNTIVVWTEPKVVYPQKEVVVVEVGSRVELKCKIYIGPNEDSEAVMYWTVDSDIFDAQKELNDTWKYIQERNMVYSVSTLTISKVPRKFLNVPIGCHILTPTGTDAGYVWFQEADHSVAHCLTASVASLAMAAAFFLFKVDLVLAYRKLLRHFAKQRDPDGKFYDAYVSFLHPDTVSSSEMESFALQILPEKLEKQHGYSLFIRGRDDCPGESVHNVIDAKLCQCRRLIIILSPEAKISTHCKKEEEFLCGNENLLCYEQKIGLYDALTKNDPRVILVEIDGPVDYSCLPKSLQYIKRKQGSLKWEKSSHKLNFSNRNFWKNLRYYMPPVPVERHQTIV